MRNYFKPTYFIIGNSVVQENRKILTICGKTISGEPRNCAVCYEKTGIQGGVRRPPPGRCGFFYGRGMEDMVN